MEKSVIGLVWRTMPRMCAVVSRAEDSVWMHLNLASGEDSWHVPGHALMEWGMPSADTSSRLRLPGCVSHVEVCSHP